MQNLINLSDNVRAEVAARLKPGVPIHTRTDLSSVVVFTAWNQPKEQALRIAKPGAFLGPLKRLHQYPDGSKKLELDFPGKVRVIGFSSAAIPLSDQAVSPELRRAQLLYNNDKALLDLVGNAGSLVASARAAGKSVDADEKQLAKIAENAAKRGRTVLNYLGIKAGVSGIGWLPAAAAGARVALPYLANALTAAWVFFRANAAASVATVVVGGSLVYGGVKLIDWLTPNEQQHVIDKKAAEAIIAKLKAAGTVVTPEAERIINEGIEKHGKETADNTSMFSGLNKTVLIGAACVGAYLLLNKKR